LLCAVVLSAGSLGLAPQPSAPEGVGTQAPRPVVRPGEQVRRDGRNTLAYWNWLGEILNKQRTIRSPKPPSYQEGVQIVVKQQLGDIQLLPVLDVDPEVIELTAKLVTLLRQTADGVNKVRWYHSLGWPCAELKQVDHDARVLRQQMEELRSRLAQRYQLEFPVLDFPGGHDRP
jgi:hypothetical protein